jgi:hypothetical protein
MQLDALVLLMQALSLLIFLETYVQMQITLSDSNFHIFCLFCPGVCFIPTAFLLVLTL